VLGSQNYFTLRVVSWLSSSVSFAPRSLTHSLTHLLSVCLYGHPHVAHRPGTIDDSKSLGLRALYRKYGFRSPDKISIKRMQAAMVKVALLVGVTLHVGLSFRRIYPPARSGASWTIGFHVKNAGNDKLKLDCDALVGADGENSRVAYAANIMSNEVQFR
jgi:hypothetical protein